MAYGLPFLSAPENNGVPVEYMIDYIRLYQNDDGVLYRIEEDNSPDRGKEHRGTEVQKRIILKRRRWT